MPDLQRGAHENWEELAPIALEKMGSGGAEYADLRIQIHREQVLYARNDRIHSTRDQQSQGVGVRALVNGSWGFAASSRLTPDAIRDAACSALEMGRAGATIPGRKVELAPEPLHSLSSAWRNAPWISASPSRAAAAGTVCSSRRWWCGTGSLFRPRSLEARFSTKPRVTTRSLLCPPGIKTDLSGGIAHGCWPGRDRGRLVEVHGPAFRRGLPVEGLVRPLVVVHLDELPDGGLEFLEGNPFQGTRIAAYSHSPPQSAGVALGVGPNGAIGRGNLE